MRGSAPLGWIGRYLNNDQRNHLNILLAVMVLLLFAFIFYQRKSIENDLKNYPVRRDAAARLAESAAEPSDLKSDKVEALVYHTAHPDGERSLHTGPGPEGKG